MNRFVHMVVLAAFLAVGLGVPMTFASEPAPAEQKEKKDMTSGKADDDKKKTRRRTWAENRPCFGAQQSCAPPAPLQLNASDNQSPLPLEPAG